MNSYRILLILGTARPGRRSERVAHFIFREISQHSEIQGDIVDVRSFLEGGEVHTEGPSFAAWEGKATAADGFVIVTPEYNHGYPGELKLLLDSASSRAYARKPVGLATVSSGVCGGARVAEHLLPVLVDLGLIPLQKPLYFPHAGDVFNTEGAPRDEKYYERTKEFLANLLWFVRVLALARATAPR